MFAKKAVDSNSYTYITGATKETTTTYAGVQISDIYKADGSSSSYNNVYVKACTTGYGLSATKGRYLDLTIPSGYRAAGSYVTLYAKGNVPWLDCKISGYWIVH